MSQMGGVTVLLEAPLHMAIMKREVSSSMYSPTACYIGRFAANMVCYTIIPSMLVIYTFWAIGIVTTAHNFF